MKAGTYRPSCPECFTTTRVVRNGVSKDGKLRRWRCERCKHNWSHPVAMELPAEQVLTGESEQMVEVEIRRLLLSAREAVRREVEYVDKLAREARRMENAADLTDPRKLWKPPAHTAEVVS